MHLAKREADIRSKLFKLQNTKEIDLKQKSNAAWVKDGESSSMFFYATIRAR